MEIKLLYGHYSIIANMLHTIEKKLEEASDKIRETVSGSSVEPNTLTRMNGCPIAHYKVSMTAGPHGPVKKI